MTLTGERTQVRPAVLADARALAACHLACWHEAYTGLLPQVLLDSRDLDEWTQRRRTQLAEPAPGVSTFVATVGDQIIGLVSAGPPRDDPAPVSFELYAIYLRKQYYGGGLAQRMFDTAVGNKAASLWVLEDNPRACSFYRRNHFSPDGGRKLYGDSAVAEIRMVRHEVA